MAVREFDATGTSDNILVSVGGCSGMEYGTIAAIIKPDASFANHRSIIEVFDSGGTQTGDGFFVWEDDGVDANTLSWIAADTGSNVVHGPVVTNGDWLFVVIRKNTGNQTPRFSVYNYATDSWAHGNGDNDSEDWPTLAGTDEFSFTAGTDGRAWHGRIATRAVWANELPWTADASGDSDIEAAGLETHLSHWAAAQPDALWAFNQESTGTAVVDLMGNGADQTSITGTSVVTDDDPPGFSFEFEPVREFDGTDDDIVMSVGSLSRFGYGTVAILAKVTDTGEFRSFFYLEDSNESGMVQFATSGTSDLDLWFFGGDEPIDGIRANDVWNLIVIRKPTGNETLRASVYNYATGTWSHGSTSGSRDDWDHTADVESVHFSFPNLSDEHFHGRVAARAAWANSTPFPANASGDSQIEAAGLEVSLDNWDSFSPDALWALNQDSTATPVEDLAGSADQTSITGTTVITSDPVPGFSYEISTVSEVDVEPSDIPVAVAANNAMPSVGASADIATVSTVANNATVTVTGEPDGIAATVSVTANNATIDAVGDAVEANAIAATVSVVANDAMQNVGVHAITATVASAAQGATPTSQSQASANRATVSVNALDATVTVDSEVVTANAQVATVGVTANGATPTGEANATATAATISVTANSPPKQVAAETATVGVAARGAQAAIDAGVIAQAQGAEITVSALNATVAVSDNIVARGFTARVSVTANNAGITIDQPPVPQYRFFPPTIFERFEHLRDHPFLRKIEWEKGISVVKKDGTFVNTRYPVPDVGGPDDLLIEGVDFFVGGFHYVIPEPIALELIADGYEPELIE